MHALILLVRLRLILKFQNFKDIEIDVESYFTKVSRVINDNLMKTHWFVPNEGCAKQN